jgi:hypothetical protein
MKNDPETVPSNNPEASQTASSREAAGKVLGGMGVAGASDAGVLWYTWIDGRGAALDDMPPHLAAERDQWVSTLPQTD